MFNIEFLRQRLGQQVMLEKMMALALALSLSLSYINNLGIQDFYQASAVTVKSYHVMLICSMLMSNF